MKNRIFKNKVSSIIGLILLIISGAFFWFGKITWGEFTAFIPFCLGLLWVKDTIFKVNG